MNVLASLMMTMMMMILASAANEMPTTESPANLDPGQAVTVDPGWACVVVHFNVSCPTATGPFRAHIMIWRILLEGEHPVAERWLLSSAERPQWASATLRGCTRVTPGLEYRSRFYYEIPEQTCVPPKRHIYVFGGVLDDYGTPKESSVPTLELAMNWTLGGFTSFEKVLAENETNALIQRVPPPPDTAELKRTDAPRHCINVSVELKCSQPFNATVRIWKSRPELIGYLVAETRLGTTTDFHYGPFVAAASLEACIPLADANIDNRASALFVSIPVHSCYESKADAYDFDINLPFQNETTAYDFRLNLGPHSKPVIEPH